MKIPVPKDEKDYYKEIYGLTHSPDMKSKTLKLAYRMADKYESLTLIKQLTYFNNRNKDYAVVIPSINEVADKFNVIKYLEGVLVIEVEINGDISIVDVESVYIIRRKPAVSTFEPVPVEYNGEMVSGLVFKTKEEETMKIETTMTQEEKDFYIKKNTTYMEWYDSQLDLAKMIDAYGKRSLDSIVSKNEIDKNDINQHYAIINVETGIVADELIGIGGRYSGKDNRGISRIGVGVRVGKDIHKWISNEIRIMKRTYEKPATTTINGLKIGSISLGSYDSPHTIILDSLPQMGVMKVDPESIEHPSKKKAKEAVNELEKFIDSLQLHPSKSEDSKEVCWDWTKALDISGAEIKSSASSVGLGGEDSFHAFIDNNSVVTPVVNKFWEERVKEANEKLTDSVSLKNVSVKKPSSSKVDVITGILHKELRNAMRYRKPRLLDMTDYNGFITQEELDLAMSQALRMLIDNPVNASRKPSFASVVKPSLNPSYARNIHIDTDSSVTITSKDLSAHSLLLAGTNKFPRGLRDITYVTTQAKYFIEKVGSYGDHIMFGVKF